LRDLDVARFLRPQLLREIASRNGVGIRTDEPMTAEALTGFLEEISREHVAYEDVKYVFFGLFCNKPNQLFQDNYARLDGEMLKALEDAGSEAHRQLFEALFLVVTVGRAAMRTCEETFTEASEKVLARLRQSKYFAYTAILAMMGILAEDDLGHEGRQPAKGLTLSHCPRDARNYRERRISFHRRFPRRLHGHRRQGL